MESRIAKNNGNITQSLQNKGLRSKMERQLNSIINEIAYIHRDEVRSQVTEVLYKFTNLRIKKDELYSSSNGWNSTQALVMYGTLPMIHRNITYNLPIEIFINEYFPIYENNGEPKIYTRPTREMIGKCGVV